MRRNGTEGLGELVLVIEGRRSYKKGRIAAACTWSLVAKGAVRKEIPCRLLREARVER